MLDHQGQISIPATEARGPTCVSTVVSYSLAYDIADVMANDNSATSLSTQDSDQHMIDSHSQKTISRANSLSSEMGHYP